MTYGHAWLVWRILSLVLGAIFLVAGTVGIFVDIDSTRDTILWITFLYGGAALIFMAKETRFTVPIMLVGVRQGHFGAVDWGALQAGVVISILPCLLIYLLLQKFYQSGLLTGAIK